jgi:hypothetical protein
MNNPKVAATVRNGRVAHTRIESDAQKNDPGSRNEVTLDSGKRVDHVKSDGTPVEIKPDTTSGFQKGLSQLKGYMTEMGSSRGELWLYQPGNYYDVRTMVLQTTE